MSIVAPSKRSPIVRICIRRYFLCLAGDLYQLAENASLIVVPVGFSSVNGEEAGTADVSLVSISTVDVFVTLFF